MNQLAGTWTADTPFGPLALEVEAGGRFRLGAHRGLVRKSGKALSVHYEGTGLAQESRSDVPMPQGDVWWIPLPNSGGVLRFLRHTSAGQRHLDFPSGLRLSVAPEWTVRPAPGALSVIPPGAIRPGHPSAAFIEIYEAFIPNVNDDHLITSMKAMLAERTRREPKSEVSRVAVGDLRCHQVHSRASTPTGERMDVTLWVLINRDHVIALAQANLENESFVTDEMVLSILEATARPNWSRAEALFGAWEQTERIPSGPLTEVVTRRLVLSPDGSYLRTRTATLQLPSGDEGPQSQPQEVKERSGHWYSREGGLLLSAGLRGYRVRRASWERSPAEIVLDDNTWTRIP